MGKPDHWGFRQSQTVSCSNVYCKSWSQSAKRSSVKILTDFAQIAPPKLPLHSVARLIQVQHLYHVVDLDIKGFFDNINHTKLIRQIWSLGIRDKKLLCIIKQMLKASVILPNGEKIYPTKGTPQGGILSPLLANIVLNELDWWIASQWENMPTRTEFTIRQNRSGAEIKSHVYRALRRSNLKEMHSVR